MWLNQLPTTIRAGLILGATLAALGCRAEEQAADSTPTDGENGGGLHAGACRDSGDCTAGQTCAAAESASNAPRLRLSVAQPDPCAGVYYCAVDADCTEGYVCETPTAAWELLECNVPRCLPACGDPARECYNYEVCQADGHCLVPRCDEPSSQGCPSTMECDPTYDPAAQTAPTGKYAPNYTLPLAVSWEEEAAAALGGCVFKSCDQPGARACNADYACEPGSDPTSTGCVGIPCAELGHCISESLICEPTSSQPRPSGMDNFGCVYKNCEETGTCPAGSVCDFSHENTTSSGCAKVRCDEPGGSCQVVGRKCAPDADSPDQDGCVPMSCDADGYDCGAGFECSPAGTGADSHGCIASAVPPAAGAANAEGGSGGSADLADADAAGAAGDQTQTSGAPPNDPAHAGADSDASSTTAGTAGTVSNAASGAGASATSGAPAIAAGANAGGTATAAAPRENGDVCASGVECKSSNCVDGRCAAEPGVCR